MNKVKQRCQNQSCAKFSYASDLMFKEIKIIKVLLYLLNIVPVVICFISTDDMNVKAICSLISFSLTIISEVASSGLSNYKEKAILEKQIYEAEITGSSFSKIEYDRESTNDMQELAIRKGMPMLSKNEKHPVQDVPDEISDDYSYLYLARKSAAGLRFTLSRLFYFYFFVLILIAATFIVIITFNRNNTDLTTSSVLLLICFWPLIIPIIRICVSCKKCMRYCVKICADIDNFFADGDDSYERLARFYYYVQNIEFEMLMAKPIIFGLVNTIYRRHLKTLRDGVTCRFIEAVKELKSKTYIQKGVISQPKGKDLITRRDYSLEELEKLNQKNKQKKKNVKTQSTAKAESIEKEKPKAKAKPVKKEETKKKVDSKKDKTKKKTK